MGVTRRTLAAHARRGLYIPAHVGGVCAKVMDSKISEFVAVTGASLEDARGLLEACHGDLDMAVNMHMETKGGGGVSEKSYKEL